MSEVTNAAPAPRQREYFIGGTLVSVAILAGAAATVLNQTRGTSFAPAAEPPILGPLAYYVGFTAAALAVATLVLIQPVAGMIAGRDDPAVRAMLARIGIVLVGLFDFYYLVWQGDELANTADAVLPIQIISIIALLYGAYAGWRRFVMRANPA